VIVSGGWIGFVARRYVTADRDQVFLLPVDMREWLPEQELAWTILDVVDQLDLSAFDQSYRTDGTGRPPYDPALMTALLLYAYADGVRSSRQIERRCARDIAYRVICGNHVPDHASIARFRARHREALNGLFVQVLRIMAAAGMVRVGLIAIDGTKLRGNARGGRNRSAEELAAEIAELSAQVEQLLVEAETVDAAEDADCGDRRGDEPPAELASRQRRLETLRRAKARLDAEAEAAQAAQDGRRAEWERRRDAGGKVGRRPAQRPPKPQRPPRVNLTDPDSKIMHSHGRYLQGYNGQATVGAGQIVLACGVTNSSADSPSLHPMLTQTRANLDAAGIGERIRALLGDSGYGGHHNLSQPTDEILLIGTSTGRKQADTEPPHHPAVQKMAARLATPAGKRLYRRRAARIEPVFGQIKNRLGEHIPFRGLPAAAAEWNLVCTSHNLLKYWCHRLQPAPATV
jgi:transposase